MTIITWIIAVMLATGAGMAIDRFILLREDTVVAPPAATTSKALVLGRGTGSKDMPSLAPMLKAVLPAVVNISASGKVRSENPLFNDPFFRRFLEEFGVPNIPRERQTQSVGSGVIVNAEKGYVLTNHHVIRNANEIYVTLHDKRRLAAKLIGSDPETDVALLYIEGNGLVSLPLGNSDMLQVGDFAVAIGNAFGLEHTVTSGIISALGRSGLGIEGYEDFIQTDASINPGNSGGALVNLKGELIGINTAIISGSGGNVGIGFAIPISLAEHVFTQISEHGEIRRGQVGLYIQDVTPELKEAMNLSVHTGAVVSDVRAGSSADKAGIEKGDVIIRFDGREITNASMLRNMVGVKAVGEKAQIELLRGGKPIMVTVEIAPSITRKPSQ